MAEPSIHPGSIAFLMAFHDAAERKLDATFGRGKVQLGVSGPCTEYSQLTRFAVKVTGEHDAMGAGPKWLQDVCDTLRDSVGGPIHVCQGDH